MYDMESTIIRQIHSNRLSSCANGDYNFVIYLWTFEI